MALASALTLTLTLTLTLIEDATAVVHERNTALRDALASIIWEESTLYPSLQPYICLYPHPTATPTPYLPRPYSDLPLP